jgi:transcriptional regulator with XRE-family HTH domain
MSKIVDAMLLQSSSDFAITKLIGERLQTLRLRSDISFAELSKKTGISRQTLHVLFNQGKGTLDTLVAVLRALHQLDRLATLIDEVPASPIQILAAQGKRRPRASGQRKPKL